jgi:hypothetical protein
MGIPPNSPRWKKLGAKTTSPEEERWLRELGHYIEKLRMPPGTGATKGLYSRLNPDIQEKHKKLAEAVDNLAHAIDGLDTAFGEVDDV